MSHRTRRRQTRPHPVGEQALLLAATRRGPATACTAADDEPVALTIPGNGPRVTYAIPAPPPGFVPFPPARVAERSHVTGRDDREISFADLPAENPDLLKAAPKQAAVTPIPRSWLQPVGLLSTHTLDERIAICDEAMFDVSVALVQLACAISAAAVAPGGVHALTMLFAPVADLLRDEPFPSEAAALMAAWAVEAPRPADVLLSEVDRRPLGRAVGYELETAVSA